MKIVTYDGRAPVGNLGSGGSFYLPDFVADPQTYFVALNEGVAWRTVKARGNKMLRLKEAFVERAPDGTVPLYRYPFMFHETSEFHPLVRKLRDRCEQLGQERGKAFPLNHAIGTFYRDGKAGITKHQDKVQDIAPGSWIYDISLGAPRMFYLVSEDGRVKQQIVLQPGSLIVLDAETNARWKHSLPATSKASGPRISVVFRSITTRLDPATGTITEADGTVTRKRPSVASEKRGSPKRAK